MLFSSLWDDRPSDRFIPAWVCLERGHPRCTYVQTARMPTLVRQYGTSGRFLIAQSDRGTASLDREQLIKTHRVSDSDNVTGCIVVEPQCDVKIHLLIWSEAIQSAPIQQLRGASILRVITDALHKQARSLGHPLFDHKCGLCDQLAGGVNIPLNPHPLCNSHDHGNCK
jgi:hypothetical protein